MARRCTKIAYRKAFKENDWSAWDYPRYNYYARRHCERRKRFVESMEKPLHCMECGGSGGWIEVVIPETGEGPHEECGWCQGTGLMTPHERGLWLKFKRKEKREAARVA